MAIQTDIKRLLKEGLTGWQAGVLVFEDSWLSSRGEGGFLSDRDIELIKSGLRTQKDIEDYNLLIRLFRTADFIERQCHTSMYAATACLERIAGLGYLEYAPFMARFALRQLPLLVTEKEYRSLKAKQRKMLLARHYCLDQVISWRAYARAPEERKAETWPEWIEGDAPELYEQARTEIMALVEAGKLQPVKLDIEADCEEARADKRKDVEGWSGSDDWTPEQREQLLQTYVSGSQLYKLGLPEWIEEIDTFKTYLIDEELWPSGDPPPYVAIVQEPDSHSLDSRGHFKRDFLKRWPLTPFDGDKEGALLERASIWWEYAFSQLKKTLARRQVLEELGRVVGLALEEGVDFAIDAFVVPGLGRYNTFASEIPPELARLYKGERLSEEEREQALEQMKVLPHTPGNTMAMATQLKAALPPIKLEKMRPPARDVTEIRGWVADVLGGGWWERASQATRKPKSMLSEEALQHWQLMKEGNKKQEEAGRVS